MRQTYARDASDDEWDFDEVYLKAREAFMTSTRTSIHENLRAGDLDPKKTNIYLCHVMRIQEDKKRLKQMNQIIDDPQLVIELYATVKERRY
ncbi:hypothetical protein L211DRAFT_893243 [Terfezia boudieri ATCC MYA-4762]|uniref:Uncharacterized protein n=1 Tax=Terfezia boudieri ATCC MYA-4762 TaxID=1051890 RepID=A0A3N4LCC0_9PEZI|nr:hypothetical protein L211DRAFT_893243 [Terfezia boudieri ATCC MYA-4762]